MFLPLHDHNKLKYIPYHYATLAIIVFTVAIFIVFQSGFILTENATFVYGMGVIPAVVSDIRTLPQDVVLVPVEASLITYAFLHGGWFHLLTNMLFVWVFGDNVEDAMGHLRFIFFYILCAIGGAVVHIWADPQSVIPLVGASGAVAGIVAAYLMLHPRVRVWCLVFNRIPLPIPAWVVLGFWISIQIINVVVLDPQSNVAWWAHIGGLITGAILILIMKRREVSLFDQDMAAS